VNFVDGQPFSPWKMAMSFENFATALRRPSTPPNTLSGLNEYGWYVMALTRPSLPRFRSSVRNGPT